MQKNAAMYTRARAWMHTFDCRCRLQTICYGRRAAKLSLPGSILATIDCVPVPVPVAEADLQAYANAMYVTA